MVGFYAKAVGIIYRASHRAYGICAHWKNYRPDSPVRQSVKIFVDGSKVELYWLVFLFPIWKKKSSSNCVHLPYFSGWTFQKYLICHCCQFRCAIPCDSVPTSSTSQNIYQSGQFRGPQDAIVTHGMILVVTVAGWGGSSNMGLSKNRGKTSKMDGENNGNPY